MTACRRHGTAYLWHGRCGRCGGHRKAAGGVEPVQTRDRAPWFWVSELPLRWLAVAATRRVPGTEAAA